VASAVVVDIWCVLNDRKECESRLQVVLLRDLAGCVVDLVEAGEKVVVEGRVGRAVNVFQVVVILGFHANPVTVHTACVAALFLFSTNRNNASLFSENLIFVKFALLNFCLVLLAFLFIEN